MTMCSCWRRGSFETRSKTSRTFPAGLPMLLAAFFLSGFCSPTINNLRHRLMWSGMRWSGSEPAGSKQTQSTSSGCACRCSRYSGGNGWYADSDGIYSNSSAPELLAAGKSILRVWIDNRSRRLDVGPTGNSSRSFCPSRR